MNRRIEGAILAGLIAAACAPASTGSYQGQDNRGVPAQQGQGRPEAPKPNEWVTYTSKLGYSVELPKSWQVTPSGELPTEERIFPDLNLSTFSKIGYQPLKDLPGFNLDQRVQDAVKSSGNIINAKKVRTQNGEGWRLSGRAPDTRTAVPGSDVEYLWQIVNGEWWWVTFTAPGLDTQINSINRVFNTFKVR